MTFHPGDHVTTIYGATGTVAYTARDPWNGPDQVAIDQGRADRRLTVHRADEVCLNEQER